MWLVIALVWYEDDSSLRYTGYLLSSKQEDTYLNLSMVHYWMRLKCDPGDVVSRLAALVIDGPAFNPQWDSINMRQIGGRYTRLDFITIKYSKCSVFPWFPVKYLNFKFLRICMGNILLYAVWEATSSRAIRFLPRFLVLFHSLKGWFNLFREKLFFSSISLYSFILFAVLRYMLLRLLPPSHNNGHQQNLGLSQKYKIPFKKLFLGTLTQLLKIIHRHC